MTNEPSPRPWRVEPMFNGVADARGEKVAANIRASDAALIVDAVSWYCDWGALSSELERLRAERDRIRDIVRRMAKIIGEAPIDWFGASFVDTQVLLTEARAAIGAGETPTGKGVGV